MQVYLLLKKESEVNDEITKIINNSNFIYCKWKYILDNKITILPINMTLYR